MSKAGCDTVAKRFERRFDIAFCEMFACCRAARTCSHRRRDSRSDLWIYAARIERFSQHLCQRVGDSKGVLSGDRVGQLLCACAQDPDHRFYLGRPHCIADFGEDEIHRLAGLGWVFGHCLDCPIGGGEAGNIVADQFAHFGELLVARGSKTGGDRLAKLVERALEITLGDQLARVGRARGAVDDAGHAISHGGVDTCALECGAKCVVEYIDRLDRVAFLHHGWDDLAGRGEDHVTHLDDIGGFLGVGQHLGVLCHGSHGVSKACEFASGVDRGLSDRFDRGKLFEEHIRLGHVL